MWRWTVPPVEPEGSDDLLRTPSDAAPETEPPSSLERSTDTDPSAIPKQSKPFAATIPFEPVAATRSFEPAAATRPYEPAAETPPFEPYEVLETSQSTRLNEPFGSMPQDDLRKNQGPMSRFPGRRPPTPTPDLTSIVAGIVFFILGGAYLLASSGHLTVNAAWSVSLLFIGLGLSGILGAVFSSRRRR